MTVALERDDSNLAIARQRQRDVDNLTFDKADILMFDFESASRSLRNWDGGRDTAVDQRPRPCDRTDEEGCEAWWAQCDPRLQRRGLAIGTGLTCGFQ